jgi:hypothetical protein
MLNVAWQYDTSLNQKLCSYKEATMATFNSL